MYMIVKYFDVANIRVQVSDFIVFPTLLFSMGPESRDVTTTTTPLKSSS